MGDVVQWVWCSSLVLLVCEGGLTLIGALPLAAWASPGVSISFRSNPLKFFNICCSTQDMHLPMTIRAECCNIFNRIWPTFCADNELVFDIISAAMDTWKKREQHSPWDDALNFYTIAEQLGRTRTGCEGCFIGPEAVQYSDSAKFVFTVDYENGRVVKLR